MDPLFARGDNVSVYGTSSLRPGFFGGIVNESPSSTSLTGSLDGMKLALLYSSSSAHQDGRESITDILRRYQRPPISESLDGLMEDGKNHVNFDAGGVHLGARVSGTPFGPINSNASMQMSIAHGGVSLRTNSTSSLGDGEHGRSVVMSVSGRSQCNHSFEGMGNELFEPLGDMFSPFEGLMPPLGGMFAVGSGSFDHISSHGVGNMSRGHASTTFNYSRPIIEEMINDDASDKQLTFTGTSDEKAEETKIETSPCLGHLPTTKNGDEESGNTKPITEEGSVLGSKIVVISSGSPVEHIKTSDGLIQTLSKEPDDTCLVTEVEDQQNETHNYSKSFTSAYYMPEIHQGNSLSPEKTHLSSSVSKITEKSVDFENPTQMQQEISDIPEPSRSKDETTNRKSTKAESRNDKLGENLSQGEKTSPINYEHISPLFENSLLVSDEIDINRAFCSPDNVRSAKHSSTMILEKPISPAESALEETSISFPPCNEEARKELKLLPREKSTKSKRKFTKQKFSDVNFGFGESKHSNQEVNVIKTAERKAPYNKRSDKDNKDFSVVSKFTICDTQAADTDIPLSSDCSESEINVDKETDLGSNDKANIADRAQSPLNTVDFKKAEAGSEYILDVKKSQTRETSQVTLEQQSIKSFGKEDFGDNNGKSESTAECIQDENSKQGSYADDKNGDSDKEYKSYSSENRNYTRNRHSDTVTELSTDKKENDVNKAANISQDKCRHLSEGMTEHTEQETRKKLEVKETQQLTKHDSVASVANEIIPAENNDDNNESLHRITFETTSKTNGERRKRLVCLLFLPPDADKPPTQIMPKEDRRNEASGIFKVSHFLQPFDMKLTAREKYGKRLHRSKSWEDELNSVNVPGHDLFLDTPLHSNTTKNKFSHRDENNKEINHDQVLDEGNAHEETKLIDVLPKVDSLEKMKLDEVLPEVDSLKSGMTLKNNDSVSQTNRAFVQSTARKTSDFPNGEKRSHTSESKKGEDISESSDGKYVTQTCKHLNTHSNNCNYASQFVCDDCGMNICNEIAAEEEAKRNKEILDDFINEYGTQTSTESENFRKKNEDMKPAKDGTSDKTTEHSSFYSTEQKKRTKSATGPELSAMVESIGLTLKDAYPDGNCLFTSVVDQLRIRGDFSYTARDLRLAAVGYLQAHPCQDDGTPLSEFLTGDERNWDKYLSSMRQDSYWGDHHTIWALANVLQKKIVIYRGDEELHRTIVEPDRAESGSPANESNVERIKGKMGSTDVERKPDVEELHLGHIAESHYVSLRPQNWQETLLSNSSGGASAWDKLPNFSSTDTSFFINYIRRGKFIDEFEERRLTSFSRYHVTEFTGDKINGLKYKFAATNKYGHRLMKEKANQMDVMETPFDTVVIPEKRFSGSAKDLISVGEGYKLGQMILVPVTPNIWYPMVEAVGVHICLKHLTVSKPKTHMQEHSLHPISFRCAWPFEAEEWKTRERKHGWPKQVTIDHVIEEGVRVVPTSSQFVNQSNIKHDTIWEYSFDISEQIVCKMDLSREMKMLYCILRKLLKFAFHGKTMISRKHIKTIFLYVCEGSSFDEINHEPEKCLLYGLNKLDDFLKCKHLPDYFMRKRNLLGDVDNSEIYWHVKMLCSLKRNMMVFLYFALDKYDVFHLFELGRVFDILNKEALLRRRVSSSGFIYLQQICATNIRCWVATKDFNSARILINTWAAELSQILRDGPVSRENLVYDVLDELCEEDRWLFALVLDSKEGTDTLQEANIDNECLGLQVLFGNEAQEILTRHTSVPYEEILVPTHILAGNMTLFAYRFGEVLRYNIGNQAAYQYAIHYFVKHHTHDLLLSIEKDNKDGNGHSSRMNILTLTAMFIELYHSYRNQNVHLFRELMELYEEICNFVDNENEFAFLSELWRYFGEVEKANEAAMKAMSLREERVNSTRV